MLRLQRRPAPKANQTLEEREARRKLEAEAEGYPYYPSRAWLEYQAKLNNNSTPDSPKSLGSGEGEVAAGTPGKLPENDQRCAAW